MAKLGAYYALCPLIDVKNIFGISEDTSRGVVIATLGKNLASRYKISDQKQVSCWRTKEKFSSPIFFDKSVTKKYVAAFNQSYIKLWDTDDNLDKVRKYKFNTQIHTLISDNDSIFVVSVNGGIQKLDEALEQRKESSVDCISTHLIDVIHRKLDDTLYIGLITKEEHYYLYWKIFSSDKYHKIALVRENLFLQGYTFHCMNGSMKFLSFWSDGTTFSSSLVEDEVQNIGELFTVIDSISMKHKVSVVSLDEHYIVLYGADVNEEGAVLVIYNTQFKVTQCKQPFKLFTNSARIWRIDDNLFLPVGQNLAVIPFYLETEQLAALVGSHKNLQDELDSDVRVINELEISSWDERYHLKKKKFDKELASRMGEMIRQGLPESVIVEQMLPDIFDKKDLATMSKIINNIHDIPEKHLVEILKYLMLLDEKNFKGEKCSLETIPSELQPLEKTQMINSLLTKSFNEEFIIPYLRKEIDLKEVMTLLKYLHCIWSEREHPVPKPALHDNQLLQWTCALIDSNYQKIVLSKDESYLAVFQDLKKLVTLHLTTLHDLMNLEPYLIALGNGSLLNKESNICLNYGIEQICLY